AGSAPGAPASLRQAGAAGTDLAPAAASTSNVASGAPTASVSPAPAWNRATRPANGEGTSTVAFAVSISTNGWFSSTVAPSATSHALTIPSSSPSPGSGV